MNSKKNRLLITNCPIPSCLYACISFISGTSFDLYWWGHDFVDLKYWENNSDISLGGFDLYRENTYGDLRGTETYKKLSSLYGLSIDHYKYMSASEYINVIRNYCISDKYFLLPMPLSACDGFSSLVGARLHYAVGKWFGFDEIIVFDQYRSTVLSLGELESKLGWVLNLFGYISYFEIQPYSPNHRLNLSSKEVRSIYRRNLEIFNLEGRRNLSCYVNKAHELSLIKSVHKLNSEYLYTIPLRIRAEKCFLLSSGFAAPLLSMLDILYSHWSKIVLRAIMNSRLGEDRFALIASDITEVGEQEELYFQQVEKFINSP